MPEDMAGKKFYTDEEMAALGHPRPTEDEADEFVRQMKADLARQRANQPEEPVTLPPRFANSFGGTEYEDWALERARNSTDE